jgi:hypothetical protein
VAERAGAWGTRVGGDEDDLLVVLGNHQDVAVDPQRPERRMGHGLRSMAGSANRVGRPDLGELLAARAQFRHQRRQPGVAGVSRGGGPQPGDRDLAELLVPGRQHLVAEQEPAPREVIRVTEQCPRQRVQRHHIVGGGRDDRRGVVHPVEQVPDIGADRNRRPLGRAGNHPGEAEHVRPLRRLQVQRRGDRVQDPRRRPRTAGLFEAGVVLDRHARPLRDLLAAQARRPPSTRPHGRGGLQRFPAVPQEAGQFPLCHQHACLVSIVPG